MSELRTGDVVRFAEIIEEGDAEQRMVLIEEPDGGRVLVRYLGTGMAFAPTARFQVNQLAKVGSVANNLANAFSSKLVDKLGANVIVKIIDENEKDGDPLVCHSHDFLDANEVMAAAWEEIFGSEIDLQDDCQREMWSRAWDIAKAYRFHLVPEEANMAVKGNPALSGKLH